MFSQKRKGKPWRLKIQLYSACFHDLHKCSKLDSRPCCLQLVLALWCCSPTVLLSKIKLYGSAKENCQHYGKTAGWHTLLERARHWSMTETAWCSRSRLAWRDGLFFSHNSCLSPKCATTNLHIVTLSETEKPTRGSCLSPSWGKDWILGKKKEEIQEPPREETWPEDERLTMVRHSQATQSETEFWSPQANDNVATQG